MEEHLDFRVQKTYTGLTTAFWELMGEKSFDSLTVNELCQRGMVRRATFYKHFGDKYEFFSFVIREILRKAGIEYQQAKESESSVGLVHWIVNYYIDFVVANEAAVSLICNTSAYSLLDDIIAAQIQQDVLNRIRLRRCGETTCSDVSSEVLAAAFTGALFYAGRSWVRQENRIDKETFVQEMCRLLIPFVPEA